MRQNALPWIGRAIERDRGGGRPYLLLGRVLAARGAADQALLSLRMALERETDLGGPVADLAVRIAQDDRLRRVVPDGFPGGAVLSALAIRLNKPEQSMVKDQLFDEALRRDPRLLEPHLVRADKWLAEVERNAADGPCAGPERAQCFQRLEDEAGHIGELDPNSDRPVILRGRALLVQGKPASADRLLADGCGKHSRPECLQWRVIAASSMKTGEDLGPAASAYLAASCSTSASCAAAAQSVGDTYAGRGDLLAAINFYERAAREAGTPEAWLKLAEAANRAGLLGRAARAYEHARGGGAKGAEELKKRLEQAQRDALLREAK
jgi:tetratricopeptide (TPR) repeat protein